MRVLLSFCSAGLLSRFSDRNLPFPQRGPLEITVLFPAGSSADVTARMLAAGM